MSAPEASKEAARARALGIRLALPALAVAAVYALRPGVVENGLRSPRLWLLVIGVVLAGRLLAWGLRRTTGRPRAAALASNALVAGAVVVLLAPSFLQRTLDEPLRPADGAAVADVPPRAPADDPPVRAAAPRELSSARLEGVGHSASGRTALVAVDGTVVLRFQDVDIEGTPGPHVHLVPAGARTPDQGVHLGELKAERGSFGYALPADLDVERAWTVLVWCRPFATPVAASDLA